MQNRLAEACGVSVALLFLAASSVATRGGPLARAASPNAVLAGLWGAELFLGPFVRGSLTIDGRGPQWHATIGGFDVPVTRRNRDLAFRLPGDQGQFRGRLGARATTIDGVWIQPAGAVHDNRYATPLHLNTVTASVWSGVVCPLDNRVSFYISVEPKADGSLAAFIVNPELNLFRRRWYEVAVNGATVMFTNPKRPADSLVGTFDDGAGRLTLPMLASQPPVVFSRRDAGDAVGFFPRSPSRPSVAIAVPVADDDGWTTAALATVGMDEKPIASLIERILTANPADNPLAIHSLLIARHGKLVLEEYFHGFSRERPHDMRSASKTFAPLLVGVARDHGFTIGPDARVYPLFHDEGPFAKWDSRKQRMTLRALMTMTSGLACDDNDEASPGNEDVMQGQTAQPDWYKYALDLPMAAEPGGRHAVYCSAGLNLVGGVVSRVAGTRLPEFFDRYVARPLQFRSYHVNLMPTGEAYMGGGLYLRARDALKLGQLYLSGGTWNGRRIISADWVRQSTVGYSAFAPQTDYDAGHEYGYGWHINPLTVDGHVFRSYSAGGNGGQIVMVIPELGLVVGFTGGSYGEFTRWYRWGLQLVPQYIIPATQRRHLD